MSNPARISAGRIGRPHGLDGSFHVTRAAGRLLRAGAQVSVAGRSRAIARRAGTEERPIVRLEGIDDRSAALELRGAELLVAGGDAPALGEDEWWEHELLGCELVDGERRLGTVSALIGLPSCEALEVRGARSGRQLLVPMVRDAIRHVRVTERRIDVDLEFLGLRDEAVRPG